MRWLCRMASANRIQQSVDVGKVHTSCHISAHKVREEKERHPRSFLGRASRMDNGELPEHKLGCTAQRDVFFHRQHTGQATDILHPRLCSPPNGIQEIYRVMTRSSTSRPTILLACNRSFSIFIFYSTNPWSKQCATSTRLGPHHSYQISSPSKASLHEPSSLLPSRDLHATKSWTEWLSLVSQNSYQRHAAL